MLPIKILPLAPGCSQHRYSPSYLATRSVQLPEEYRYLGSVAGQHGERLTSQPQSAIVTKTILLVCIDRRTVCLATCVQHCAPLVSAIVIFCVLFITSPMQLSLWSWSYCFNGWNYSALTCASAWFILTMTTPSGVGFWHHSFFPEYSVWTLCHHGLKMMVRCMHAKCAAKSSDYNAKVLHRKYIAHICYNWIFS